MGAPGRSPGLSEHNGALGTSDEDRDRWDLRDLFLGVTAGGVSAWTLPTLPPAPPQTPPGTRGGQSRPRPPAPAPLAPVGCSSSEGRAPGPGGGRARPRPAEGTRGWPLSRSCRCHCPPARPALGRGCGRGPRWCRQGGDSPRGHPCPPPPRGHREGSAPRHPPERPGVPSRSCHSHLCPLRGFLWKLAGGGGGGQE